MVNLYDKIKSGYYDNTLPYYTARSNPEGNKKYHAESARLVQLFQNDLKEEFGVSENPKASLLFNKAWEFGHSAGYSEIYLYYADLVELIR